MILLKWVRWYWQGWRYRHLHYDAASDSWIDGRSASKLSDDPAQAGER